MAITVGEASNHDCSATGQFFVSWVLTPTFGSIAIIVRLVDGLFNLILWPFRLFLFCLDLLKNTIARRGTLQDCTMSRLRFDRDDSMPK